MNLLASRRTHHGRIRHLSVVHRLRVGRGWVLQTDGGQAPQPSGVGRGLDSVGGAFSGRWRTVLPEPSQTTPAAVASAPVASIPETPDRQPAPPPTPAPQWRNLNFVDEFGEPTGRGAVSETVRSIRPMSFPYTGTDARIFVDCDSTWIRFSEAPNLTGGNIADGYTQYSVSVRVDGEDVGRWRVSQSWGDKDLRFTNGSEASTAISSGSTFAVALRWHGEGSVAFSWPLTGSSEAIAASCD